MQQIFRTRNYSIRDFNEWKSRGELVLAPKFQRREVWSDKARSYLIDTIVRGKPIPKIYMRQDINPNSHKVSREIVDGQQRLGSVLSFLEDGFKLSKTHNAQLGGSLFSDLSGATQRDILKYEFAVDLLEDMPDSEIYDIFARINTNSEKLKPQELRNAYWFGEFKSSVYLLSAKLNTFFVENKIISARQVLRMAEAEFISDLLLATHEGIRAFSKQVIDGAYKKYDDRFPDRHQKEQNLVEVCDTIAGIFEGSLEASRFRATRLFYPLFCAVYHIRFGLPGLTLQRHALRVAKYPRVHVELDNISAKIDSIEAAKKKNATANLSASDARFYNALTEHWVHADKRQIMTVYLVQHISKALG